MRLYVYVLQAKDLPVNDSFVKLHLGKLKSKTRVLRNSTSPVWNEEFVFRVHDFEDEEVVVSVFHHEDDSGIFNGSSKLVGRVRIPVRSVAEEVNGALLPTWFVIEKPKNGKFVNIDCGKILLTLSLHGKGLEAGVENSDVNIESSEEFEAAYKSSHDIYSSKSAQRKQPEGKKLIKAITTRYKRLFSRNGESPRSDESSEVTVSDYEDPIERPSSACSFEDGIDMMQSRDNEQEMPENLQGGVVLDQVYMVVPYDLNKFLFAPGSPFMKELAELQGTTDLQEGPWEWKSGDTPCLTRVVTYTRAATKLVKAVKATEEQIYLKADGQQFGIHTSVSTPEVPCGNSFNVEMLYKIVPGPETPSGEETSRLVVSWGICFSQSTMMRSMIESGVKQGLKESFEQFSDLMAKNYRIFDSVEVPDKEQVLATMQAEQRSDWRSASQYFCSFTVVSAVLMLLYVVIHILLCESGKMQGLEFYGFDLPDSFGELFTCGILFLQLERVYGMVLHFVQARKRGGSDRGVKANGEGWILTVALVKGVNLASVESTGLSDPYVVLTCNGKTRTSSVMLQAQDPQWNEILEFDAMEEPPSVLDVEVFDFDGPFDQAISLGHAEINFLKHSSSELADLWVPLEGKLALASQSKLHLRIYLDNKNGVETIKEYLTKMEKEVGKKLNLRSPRRNSAFQKLFELPLEEFLISDFTCYLKRKLPSQGKLFLSARIVGFYANFFGHKTKFFFLWEDIDDIQVLRPSLASVGSPTLVITLKKGRGLDARHGAKSHDEEGRLMFYFQSFVSFDVAFRTITALWKTRTLSPDQRARIAEEQQDQADCSCAPENAGIILNADESKMDKIYSSELPLNVKSLMGMFEGGEAEHRIMEKSGCLNYATTEWEPVRQGVTQRHVSYKFNRHVSIFGGDVTCTQQKSSVSEGEDGWFVDEAMALHDVPFGDHFRVQFRFRIEKSALAYNACKCDVFLGLIWLKTTKFQERISHNVTEKFANRLKEMFELVEREVLLTSQQDDQL